MDVQELGSVVDHDDSSEAQQSEPSEVAKHADVGSFLKVGMAVTSQSENDTEGKKRYSSTIRLTRCCIVKI